MLWIPRVSSFEMREVLARDHVVVKCLGALIQNYAPGGISFVCLTNKQQ